MWGWGTIPPRQRGDDRRAQDAQRVLRGDPRGARTSSTPAKREGRRVICVGTTSVRTVESASTDDGVLHPGRGNTEIFIYPGYKFKIVDC